MKTDEKILDLEGDKCEEYIINFEKELDKTALGKMLIKEGFTLIDTDVDDMEATLVFAKE